MSRGETAKETGLPPGTWRGCTPMPHRQYLQVSFYHGLFFLAFFCPFHPSPPLSSLFLSSLISPPYFPPSSSSLFSPFTHPLLITHRSILFKRCAVYPQPIRTTR